MIDLTQMNGTPFTLNSDLIEIIENIPETKILLTNGKYYLVREDREEVVRRVVDYERRIFRHEIMREQAKNPQPEDPQPEDMQPDDPQG
jgi:flagellar protein FlbD